MGTTYNLDVTPLPAAETLTEQCLNASVQHDEVVPDLHVELCWSTESGDVSQ